jgi:hypothetical protein
VALRFDKREGGKAVIKVKDRRSGRERRSGEERREAGDVSDLYRSDLDRHLWSWATPRRSRGKRGKLQKKKGGTRKVGIWTWAAGAAAAVAGLSFLLYRRRRKGDSARKASSAPDLDEADFEGG